MKILRTVLIVASLLSVLMLDLTKVGFLNSISAFANQPNKIWYILFHSLGAMAFFFNGAIQRRFVDIIIGFGMLGILGLDMYQYSSWHNILTVATMALAIFNMIFYSSDRNRPINTVLGALAAGVFSFSYTEPTFHFFLGEYLGVIFISVNLLRRIWISPSA